MNKIDLEKILELYRKKHITLEGAEKMLLALIPPLSEEVEKAIERIKLAFQDSAELWWWMPIIEAALADRTSPLPQDVSDAVKRMEKCKMCTGNKQWQTIKSAAMRVSPREVEWEKCSPGPHALAANDPISRIRDKVNSCVIDPRLKLCAVEHEKLADAFINNDSFTSSAEVENAIEFTDGIISRAVDYPCRNGTEVIAHKIMAEQWGIVKSAVRANHLPDAGRMVVTEDMRLTDEEMRMAIHSSQYSSSAMSRIIFDWAKEISDTQFEKIKRMTQ